MNLIKRLEMEMDIVYLVLYVLSGSGFLLLSRNMDELGDSKLLIVNEYESALVISYRSRCWPNN